MNLTGLPDRLKKHNHLYYSQEVETMKLYDKKRKLIILQKYARRFINTNTICKRKQAILTLQLFAKVVKARSTFKRFIQAIKGLQAKHRMVKTRGEYHEKKANIASYTLRWNR